MRKKVFLTVFCISFSLLSQEKTSFGQLTKEEINFVTYEKDTMASAIYLYEKGENFFEIRNDYIRLITKYHAKIKILRKEGFEHSTISIPYYHNSNATEKVEKIQAITHNGNQKRFLAKDKVFKVDESEGWSTKRFTFPDVRVGSVLEYSYEVESPFFYNLTGWQFQASIPKVYTEYNAKIPGNWAYNRTLSGELPLDINDAKIKKDCFEVPSFKGSADCEVLKYAMNNVPAFKDDEAFMLSGNNYRSNLKFELSQYHSFKGGTTNYTKTWKAVDKEFKTDRDIGRQLKKKNFFEKNIPDSLFTVAEPLERAKNIFKFVQNHFSWNKKYGLWKNNRVKKAFEEKRGNVAEINITLINLLNSVGLKTDLMLLSTRNHGLPKRNHPVISDFNYIIAKTTINGKEYLLDATDKIMPFGVLPFRCLNYYGRVMDFEKESYWHVIAPVKDNRHSIRGEVNFDMKEKIAHGKLVDVSIGYESVNQKKKLLALNQEEYLEDIEKQFGPDFYIEDHNVNEKLLNEDKLLQQFQFEIEDIFGDSEIYFNPFLRKFFDSNPFKAEERNYPIDFGYPRQYGYFLSIAVPEGYHVKNLPEKVALKLPEDSAVLVFDCKHENGRVNVFFQFSINGIQFTSEAYDFVKTMFMKVVDVQKQSLVVFKKI